MGLGPGWEQKFLGFHFLNTCGCLNVGLSGSNTELCGTPSLIQISLIEAKSFSTLHQVKRLFSVTGSCREVVLL